MVGRYIELYSRSEMNQVTIYSSQTPNGHIVRSGNGSYPNAAMWNTVTNLLRIMNAILTALATSEQEYYITADNRFYIVK